MTDPDMGHWEYRYDANGNLVYQKDAKLQEIRFEYDALNRVILKDYPTGTDITYTYDEAFSTNRKGRLTTLTDASGTTKYYYDEMGQITKTEKTISSTTYTTQTQYDALGRVKKIIYPDSAEVDYTYDGNGNIKDIKSGATTYATYNEYSALSQPKLVTYKRRRGQFSTCDKKRANRAFNFRRKTSMTDPDMGHWEYRYDANGNLVYQKDAKLQEITFEYDALNRVTLKDYPTGTDIIYAYDEPFSTNRKGRLTTLTDASGTTKFYYDSMGQITKTEKTISTTTYTTQTDYDALGRVKKIIYPDSAEVDYTYDGNGNIKDIKSGATTYATYNEYSALSQPKLVTYGNNVTTQYQYDLSHNRPDRLLSIATNSPTAGLMNLSYAYDNGGNITGITDYLDSSRTRSYVYDNLDRLIEADSPSYGGKLLYQYDKIGNMTYNCRYGYYYYDDPLHKHAVTRIVKNGQTVDSYTYDANGNMTSGAGRTLTYDYDNRPTSITANGNAVVNVYDASGNRVRKMKSSPTEDITTYIGQIYDCNSATGQCTKYIFAGTQRIAQVKGSEINYYHTDHLGSSSIITDATGNKVEDLFYYPYGEIKTNTGSVNVKHKFAGHEYDAETGLIYMGARYYDPKLARFISADTIVPLPFYPQSLNRYAYAYNNPIVIIDLDGHCAFLAGNPTGTYHWVGNRSSGPSGNWASRAASRAWNAIKTGGQILITAAANLAGGFVATVAVHATGLATGYNTTAMNNVGNAIMNGANRFAVAIGGAVIEPSPRGGGGGPSGQQGNSGEDSNNMNLPPLRAPWEFFNDKPEDYAAVFPNGDIQADINKRTY